MYEFLLNLNFKKKWAVEVKGDKLLISNSHPEAIVAFPLPAKLA